MSKSKFLSRYSLIVNKLRRHPADLKSILEYLQRQSELQGIDLEVSSRTFGRYISEIRSSTGIDIQYDFSRKVYYIEDAGRLETSERILEAFDTLNVLSISDGLSRYLHFEKRRPQGSENLYGLLNAIKNREVIRFNYFKFWEDYISERIGEPYALKEFNNRWYLLANDKKDNVVKTFALDRLSDLEITRGKFKYPDDYNVEDAFRYSFGITIPENGTPQDIILSFDPFQGKYIKTLPLHNEQEIIVDNEQELRIRLKLHITEDFIMELLSYGVYVKVLSPASLVARIKVEYENALKQYEVG